MLSTERPRFDEQLEILFGGFPSFLTPPRKEAYWRGLQKMQLSTFTRCVDHVLSERGNDKLPTPNMIWQVSHQLRNQQPLRPQELTPIDKYIRFADHLFYNYLRKHATSNSVLPQMIEAKRSACDAYRSIGTEELVDPEEMQKHLHARWNELRIPPTAEELRIDREKIQHCGHL